MTQRELIAKHLVRATHRPPEPKPGEIPLPGTEAYAALPPDQQLAICELRSGIFRGTGEEIEGAVKTILPRR
jgi:hypothetical protein